MPRYDRYTKKETKYIVETYNKLKDDDTLHADVIAIIAQELGRPIPGLTKRVQFLQKIGKIPRNKKPHNKPKLAVKLREPITGTAYMDGRESYRQFLGMSQKAIGAMDLSNEHLNLIMSSKVPSKYDYLDKELECGYSQNLTIDKPTKPKFMFHDISFLYGVIFACLIILILWSQYYA